MSYILDSLWQGVLQRNPKIDAQQVIVVVKRCFLFVKAMPSPE